MLIGKTHKIIRKCQAYERDGLEALLMIQRGKGRKPHLTRAAFEHNIELQKKKGGRIHC